MKSVEPESHNEIIIVRRGGYDEDEHHGGAWEIAYADFMTSMMAFFLVMWLVNAANEQTKAAVAAYFNPIKLVDRSTSSRGIEDNNSADDEDKIQDENSKGKPSGVTEDEKSSGVDQQKMMSEPYQQLDQIAKKSVPANSSRLEGSGGSSSGGSQKGASGGTAYRDPFSPDYWSENASQEVSVAVGGTSQNSGGRDPNLPSQVPSASTVATQEMKVATNETKNAGEGAEITQHLQSAADNKLDAAQNEITTPAEQKAAASGAGSATAGAAGNATEHGSGSGTENEKTDVITPADQEKAASPAGTETADQTENATKASQGSETEKAQSEQTTPAAQENEATGQAGESKDQKEKTGQSGQPAVQVTKSETPEQAAKDASLPKVVREISGELSKLIQDSAGVDQPMVRVVSVKDGIAIELMDQANYGMFAIGSAKPDKKVVDLMAGIAKILQNNKGDVIVSGHTDSRPYKTATYDNWQLSSSRAQMAYYMLVRGGLDEKRILRVEGYADHQLKNKADPYAAENRRIEVFMRLPQAENGQSSNPSVNGRKKQ
ncbi:flagellar motor protein MotB [uncultured Bartonella sp.]|uniref:flagellar motor protein MotB n=1 Tax=uncultured Bartonella sp. TaxID=104108 RepID=UPI0026164B87|nr:flagellar motor protein MotB [uncultured Bartonella sp.]